MKKIMVLILLSLFLAGCQAENITEEVPSSTTEAITQLGNPWKSYDTLAEAETAASLSFPMPERVADSYVAEAFRVMAGRLLEVVYRNGEFEVTVRMSAGEGQDLSGVYGEFENVQTAEVDGAVITTMRIDGGVLQLISKDGYSYSLYAPNQYWGDSNIDFLQYLYDAK